MKKLSNEETIKMNSLQRNVYGKNLINDLTIKNLKIVLPQLSNFIGKKIILANGSFSSKFEIKFLDPKFFFRSNLTTGYESLWLKNDITVHNTEFGVNYYKNEVYIGKIKNDILTEVLDLKNIVSSNSLSKKLDPEVIKKKIQKYEDLQAKIRSLKSEVYNFI